MKCPSCGLLNTAGTKICDCGWNLETPTVNVAKPEEKRQSFIVTVFWCFAVIGALLGGATMYMGLAEASGAPQQAAAGAMGAGIAIIPYCLARAMSELGRK